MRKYKIGEFSKRVGVTQEFLKHYQNNGILIPNEITEAKYRYYDQRNASTVLEIIKNKNYGFSVKEIEQVFRHRSTAEVLSLMEPKIEQMQKQLIFMEGVIEEYQKLKQFCEETRQDQWFVKSVEAFYFLPHVDIQGFIDNPLIYEILPVWTQWLPIVKSCQKCPACQHADYIWGLSVPQQAAKQIGLPVNSCVQACNGGRFFEYHSIFFLKEKQENPIQKALLQMETLGLELVGSVFRNILMYTEYQTDSSIEHSVLYIPFKDKNTSSDGSGLNSEIR